MRRRPTTSPNWLHTGLVCVGVGTIAYLVILGVRSLWLARVQARAPLQLTAAAPAKLPSVQPPAWWLQAPSWWHTPASRPAEPAPVAPPVAVAAPAGPARAPRAEDSSTGVVVTDERIVISDWGAWVTHASQAIARARGAGAQAADQVLASVFQSALPQYAWPPKASSRLFAQYRRLVPVLSRALNLPQHAPRPAQAAPARPAAGPHLRVIK